MAINALGQVKLPGGGETIDFIDAACGEGTEYYYQGNMLKYFRRYREKGEAESLKKARWYLDRLIGNYQDNMLKYVRRYREKGGAESLKKARWYLDRLIGMQEIKEMKLLDD